MMSEFPNTLMDEIVSELTGMIMREFSTNQNRTTVEKLVYSTMAETTRRIQREFAEKQVKNRYGILDPTNGRQLGTNR